MKYDAALRVKVIEKVNLDSPRIEKLKPSVP